MAEQPITSSTQQKTLRLQALFEKLLPLVDAVADKIRLVLIVGVVLVSWIGIWLIVIKQYALAVSISIIALALLPLLILLRFWLAFEELKDLPDIADQMLGDAKQEVRESIANIQSGKTSKMSVLSATKGLWSIGSMLREGRDLLGSYLTMTTLVNPFMLVLGVLSLGGVFLLMLISVLLILFR